MNWQKRPQLRFVICIAALFWVVCSVLVLQRYYNFFPTFVSFDQGIFNQVFWNTLHGRWFESSLSSTESIAVMQGELPDVAYRRLGQHFTPALLLWIPWYALFQSAAGLSILQVTLVTAAGLVLYALARHYHPPLLSALIAVSFYGANAVIAPTLANFHDICQLPLFIFGLLLAIEKRVWWVVPLLSLLILAVREDSGILLFSIGLYFIASRRLPRLGIGLCLVSFAYVVAVTTIVMPSFSDDVSGRFMIEQFGQFVDDESASTLEVLWGMVRNPGLLLLELIRPIDETISHLAGQWLPLMFIPAISPSAWLLVSCPLFKLLLQQEQNALSLHLRYALTIVPGLFYGAILWWAAHPQALQRRTRQIWIGCIALSLILTLTSNPNRALSFLIPDSFQPWVYVSPKRQDQHGSAIRRLMSQIPPDESVSATDQILSHLSGRRAALRFPFLQFHNDAGQDDRAQYVIADLWYLQQQQVAFVDYRNTLQGLTEILDRLIDRQRYGLLAVEDGVVLLRWQAEPDPQALANWQTYRQELDAIFQQS